MPGLDWMRVVALIAFVGTYLGLALGRLPGFRVDRTGVAIIGAAVMVVAGVLPWDKAVAAVDAHTLVLLFGMMIVAAYLRLSGFFHLVTHWAVRRARGPVGLLTMVVLASGVLSALFVNDVICLCSRRSCWPWSASSGFRRCRTSWRWRWPPTWGASRPSPATRRTC